MLVSRWVPVTEAAWAHSLATAAMAAATSERRFGAVLRRGTLLLGLYTPSGIDPQTPHEQDEVYIVVSGRGEFVQEGERISFGPGDAIFVAAGEQHRFENFSEDFATWVVFYGPKGGETP